MNCPTCKYPLTGETCGNPGCKANPDIPEDIIARWEAEEARKRADEAERERIRKIRRGL